MTPNNDEDNCDCYTSDDFERGLKAYKLKIAEAKKRPKFGSNDKTINEKRKRKNATSTQQVIICLITIKKILSTVYNDICS